MLTDLRLNMEKMSVLPRLIYKSNDMLIKIPAGFKKWKMTN